MGLAVVGTAKSTWGEGAGSRSTVRWTVRDRIGARFFSMLFLWCALSLLMNPRALLSC